LARAVCWGRRLVSTKETEEAKRPPVWKGGPGRGGCQERGKRRDPLLRKGLRDGQGNAITRIKGLRHPKGIPKEGKAKPGIWHRQSATGGAEVKKKKCV